MDEVFEGSFSCNSEKVVYPLKVKFCNDTIYVGKDKEKFCLLFNNHKRKHQSFRTEKKNVAKKGFHSQCIKDCHKSNDDWEIFLLGKCEA